MTVPVWVVALWVVLTGAVGVLAGFLVHWCLEAWALRPAYLAERERIRSGDVMPGIPGWRPANVPAETPERIHSGP